MEQVTWNLLDCNIQLSVEIYWITTVLVSKMCVNHVFRGCGWQSSVISTC